MKKRYIILMAVLVLVMAAAEKASTFRVNTHQEVWKVAESCTSAGDEPTALGVTERTFQTVLAAKAAASSGDGEIEWYIVPTSWNNVRFTAIGITDNGDYDVDVFSGTLPASSTNNDSLAVANARNDDCNLTHIGTLAFVIGTQSSTESGYEMADAVVVTTKDATTSWTSASNAGDDTCEAVIDLQGANLLVFVPWTCDANSKLLIKGY